MQAAKHRDRCCAVGGGQAEGLASAVLQNQQQLLESLDVSQGFDPPLSNAPPPVPSPPQVAAPDVLCATASSLRRACRNLR